MKRLVLVLVLAVASTLGAGSSSVLAAGSGAANAHALPQSEIFATNNTATITDPNDPRLHTRLVRFEHQVDDIIRDGGAQPRRSTLLDGVFWSSDQQAITYETSREFDVDRTDPAELHTIADAVRVQFHQESVLTFEFLPRTSPRVNAVQIETPGIDVQRLHDGLVANPTLRDELVGGSVTKQHELILIASLSDLAMAQQFIASLGGTPSASTIEYGADEFVG
jgi:hypothetical protein